MTGQEPRPIAPFAHVCHWPEAADRIFVVSGRFWGEADIKQFSARSNL
jgi:hypothetical protein